MLDLLPSKHVCCPWLQGYLQVRGTGYRRGRKGNPLPNIYRQWCDAKAQACIVIEQDMIGNGKDCVVVDLSPLRVTNIQPAVQVCHDLAAAAGADPVTFRLKHLKDDRGSECIQTCVKAANWQTRPSPNKTAGAGDVVSGRGFAYVFYDNARTYVSAVCEVEVNRKSGHVRATRFVIGHDCGLVINPDGVKAQIEGGIIQTLSRTLIEEVKWDASRVTSVDWASYPILAFGAVPKIEITLIDRPDQPAWGAGEPICAVVPSALANAIFDATGARVRTAPYTAERVKAALARS